MPAEGMAVVKELLRTADVVTENFRPGAMEKIGLDLPKSGLAHSMEEAWAVLKKIGLPLVIRPSFTLGGTGGGIATTGEESLHHRNQWGFVRRVRRYVERDPSAEANDRQPFAGARDRARDRRAFIRRSDTRQRLCCGCGHKRLQEAASCPAW